MLSRRKLEGNLNPAIIMSNHALIEYIRETRDNRAFQSESVEPLKHVMKYICANFLDERKRNYFPDFDSAKVSLEYYKFHKLPIINNQYANIIYLNMKTKQVTTGNMTVNTSFRINLFKFHATNTLKSLNDYIYDPDGESEPSLGNCIIYERMPAKSYLSNIQEYMRHIIIDNHQDRENYRINNLNMRQSNIRLLEDISEHMFLEIQKRSAYAFRDIFGKFHV